MGRVVNYLDWCDQTRHIPLDLQGVCLDSANKVKVVSFGGEQLLLKIIRDETKYVPGLKILGELAYSLFDWHLSPGERVTPNVCPVSPNTLVRQFIAGCPGEKWRGDLYAAKKSLESADLTIINAILESYIAQRIALLDFIFLCQDRSARNWIVTDKGRFWAVDNGMLWAYRGRHTDKEVIRTGKVDHLNSPIEAIIRPGKFSFQIGIFSSLYAGHRVNEGLLMWLYQLDCEEYFDDLASLVAPLDYPPPIVDDWRFSLVRRRAEWLLKKRQFPTLQDDYWGLVEKPKVANEIWRRTWETNSLET